MRRPDKPSEQEVVESIGRQIGWNREYAGLDRDGIEERARQLRAMKKPPAFQPAAPEASPPKRKG